MTVRELILNPEFDLHCNFEIFDCSRSTFFTLILAPYQNLLLQSGKFFG